MKIGMLDHGRPGRLFCCLLSLLLALGMARQAQAGSTTMLQDVVYRADGTPAKGTLVISWPAFTTADNLAVAAGSMSVTIGPQGAISVPLMPNAGGTPDGTYYRVVYKLDDGSTSEEYWSVPATGTATIAMVRSKIVPSGVAMQVVSRQYVDSALSAAVKLCPLPNAQSCVNALASTGGTVYLGAGTYTGAITLPDNANCVNLVGAGIDVTFLPVNAATTAVIAKGNASLPTGCRITDLTIDGNLQATYGMQLQKGKGWQLQRLKVKRVVNSTGEGIILGESGTAAEFYEARIRDVSIAFEAGDYSAANRPLNGLHLLGTATDNYIDDITAWNMSHAGVVDDGADNHYDGVHVYGFPLLTYYPAYAMEIFAGAHITHLTSDGVSAGGVHARGDNNSVTNSHFDWPAGGAVSGAFPIVADAGTDYNVYTGNTVVNGSGLNISGTNGVFAKIGTSYFPGNNTEIADNTNYGDASDGAFISFHTLNPVVYGQGTPLAGLTIMTPFASFPTLALRLRNPQTADLLKCLSADLSTVLCEITNAGNAVFAGSLSAGGSLIVNSSGVLQLPPPTTSTLGGVQAANAVSHQWVDSISASGVSHLSQPAATDISGCDITKHPCRVGSASLTAQGGSLSNQSLFTCSASGQYLVQVALYTTTAGSSGTVQAFVSYNTGFGSASLYSGTAQLNTAGSNGQATGNMIFHCASGQAVTYSTTFTCSSCGSPQYGIDLTAFQLQ